MNRRRAVRPPGQIRQSQLITTFGPGSMLDLPNHSVLIGGLEYWSAGGDDIPEPRLTEKLCRLLSVPSIQLRTPPPDQEDPALRVVGEPTYTGHRRVAGVTGPCHRLSRYVPGTVGIVIATRPVQQCGYRVGLELPYEEGGRR